MFDFDAVVNILCAYPPVDRPGQDQAYHATTAGYILGAVARAASGETLPGLLKRIIADPLGCEHMTFACRKTAVTKSRSACPPARSGCPWSAT